VNLPEGAEGFTTIELKSNFLGTNRGGAIALRAGLVHGGRTTQVWDATVSDEGSGKPIALFRCTQTILYPRSPLFGGDRRRSSTRAHRSLAGRGR
jgi:1,4-dihydroxy-2-naphthoyl-CoA hydrolase